MPEEVRVDELRGVLHTWLNYRVEDLQFELPSGKMAASLIIADDAAVFRASERFGEASVPYAESPATHREYLASEDVVDTEGAVEYALEEALIELPEVIYFEERVEFDSPVTATDPNTIAARLEEELNAIAGINKAIEATPPEGI